MCQCGLSFPPSQEAAMCATVQGGTDSGGGQRDSGHMELMYLLASDLSVYFPASHPQAALDARPASREAVWVEHGQHMAPVPSCLCMLIFPHAFF